MTISLRFAAAVVAAVLACFQLADQAAATTWTVVQPESRIAFSGTHAGRGFKGTFERWTAAIVFDPANLAGSRVTVTVELASAKTGDATYDKTLPSVDWFDIAKSPAGVFEATAFRALGGAAYEAEGTLTIRGIKVPVKLPFEFKASGDTARITGKVQVKRLDWSIGKSSDAPGEWVSLDIPVEIAVSLRKS